MLTRLALDAGRPVTTRQLVADVWGQASTTTVGKQLHIVVSKLRDALTPGTIVTVPGGYLLDLPRDQVDAHNFTLLAGVESRRLEEERLAVFEDHIDLRLAAGDHHAVVADLAPHVQAHPLRQGPRAQLMLALYRTARPAEALTVYQEGHTAMVEELGLEPGARLRRLQDAILTRDPVLDLAALAQSGTMSPPSCPPTPGRSPPGRRR
ncbi:BTAD domain-containing putative transcriptional regulator [Nonomuraea sp. NPDC051941]|uniref:AfsR/SARP family transcriptional regulator n=1 Tax=Nonomuraea sp. NPDC051941 TaxID=3364373 RepID=UPI0037CA19E1